MADAVYIPYIVLFIFILFCIRSVCVFVCGFCQWARDNHAHEKEVAESEWNEKRIENDYRRPTVTSPSSPSLPYLWLRSVLVGYQYAYTSHYTDDQKHRSRENKKKT